MTKVKTRAIPKVKTEQEELLDEIKKLKESNEKLKKEIKETNSLMTTIREASKDKGKEVERLIEFNEDLKEQIKSLKEGKREVCIYYIDLLKKNRKMIYNGHEETVSKTINTFAFEVFNIDNKDSLLYISREDRCSFKKNIAHNIYLLKYYALLNDFFLDLDCAKKLIDYTTFFTQTDYIAYSNKRACLYTASMYKYIEAKSKEERKECVDKFCKELYDMTLKFVEKIRNNNGL